MLNLWRLQMKQMHTNFSEFVVFTSQMIFSLALAYSCPRMLFRLGWPLCKYFLLLDPTYFAISHKRTLTFLLSLVTWSTISCPLMSEGNWMAHWRPHTLPFWSYEWVSQQKKPFILTCNLLDKWHHGFSVHCNVHLTILRPSCKQIPRQTKHSLKIPPWLALLTPEYTL